MEAYGQDIIAPVKVEHRLDFGGVTADGICDYHYNYLVYQFRDDRVEISARSYLDTINEVAIYKPDSLGWQSEFVMQVLVFLAMRYRTIKYLATDGYVPIEKSLAEEVLRQKILFMREPANAD